MVHVSGHELFGRTGDNLTLTVPVTFPELALGTDPHRADAVRVRCGCGCRPAPSNGRKFRVKGAGVQRKDATGDLIVTVEVAVPQRLSAEAKTALEAFAKAQDADPREAITRALRARRGRSASTGPPRQERRPGARHDRTGFRSVRAGRLATGRSGGPEKSGQAGPVGSHGPIGSRGFEMDAPLFVISVAAQLAGMHAQTLRSYDREGLVSPGRTSGGGRRYSQRDIELLREVQKLSQDDGVNRAGIRRIIELEAQVDALRDRLAEMVTEAAMLREELLESRMDAANAAANAIAGLRRDVVPWQESSTALVAWRRPRRG